MAIKGSAIWSARNPDIRAVLNGLKWCLVGHNEDNQ